MAYRRAPARRPTSVRAQKKRKTGIAIVAGRLLVIGVLCLIAGRIGILYAENMLMLIREARAHRQEIASLRQEVEIYAQKNAQLEREEQRLKTPRGIIPEARKKGYGFPGERLLVLPPDQPASGQ